LKKNTLRYKLTTTKQSKFYSRKDSDAISHHHPVGRLKTATE